MLSQNIGLTNTEVYTGNEAGFICTREQDNPRKASWKRTSRSQL